MSDLKDLELKDLKEMARGLGVDVKRNWGKDKTVEAINEATGEVQPAEIDTLVEVEAVEEPEEKEPLPEITRQPEKREGGLTKEQIEEALRAYIARGLKVTVDDECWTMRWSIKEACGTIHMPIKQVQLQANMLMKVSYEPSKIMSQGHF